VLRTGPDPCPQADEAPVAGAADVFVQQVRLDPVADQPDAGYPFDLPVVRALRAGDGGLAFDRPVTFLVGHNGSGKSTLIEALAVAVGLDPEGGSPNSRFSTADAHSALGGALAVRRGRRTPRSSLFLRAESFVDVASEIDRLDREPDGGGRVVDAYGGRSLHERSHGESFLDLFTHRLRPDGLYLLDEPEAALSPQGAMAALARIHEPARTGAQFVVATHSPNLLAVPDARYLERAEDGSWRAVDYDEAMPVTLTRAFRRPRPAGGQACGRRARAALNHPAQIGGERRRSCRR
jgi:predicted ATPase